MKGLGIAEANERIYKMNAERKIRLSAFKKRVEVIDNLLEYFNWDDEVIFLISELNCYHELSYIFRNCQDSLDEILNNDDFLNKYNAWADWAKPVNLNENNHNVLEYHDYDGIDDDINDDIDTWDIIEAI